MSKLQIEDYPEHTKLSAIKDKSQAIGQFLEWLPEQGITLCGFVGEDKTSHAHYYPYQKTIQQLLSEYFEIDLEVLEKEKQQMLEKIRAENK